MTGAAFDKRRRLLRLIESLPGLHLSELARRAKISEPLGAYHVSALAEAGVVEGRRDGGFTRFYPLQTSAPSAKDQALVGLLRQPVALNIALFLLEHERATQTQLTRELELAKSTVSYHVARLEQAGLLGTDGDGLFLRDSKRVRSSLTRWEPSRDLTRRFASLWRSFYGSRR